MVGYYIYEWRYGGAEIALGRRIPRAERDLVTGN
jgi:hypothetical protein